MCGDAIIQASKCWGQAEVSVSELFGKVISD